MSQPSAVHAVCGTQHWGSDPCPGQRYGDEVARLLLPVPVRNMTRLSDYLENAYGKGLTMHQEDDWLVFNKPVEGP